MQYLDNKENLKFEKADERRLTGLATDIIEKIAFQFNRNNEKYKDEVLNFIKEKYKVADSDDRKDNFDFWLWYNGENDIYYFDLSINKQNSVEKNKTLAKDLQCEIQENFKDVDFKACNLWSTIYDIEAVDRFLESNSKEILLQNMKIVSRLMAERYNINFHLKAENLVKLDELRELYLNSLVDKHVKFYGVAGKIIKLDNGEYVFKKRKARNYISIYSDDIMKIEEV